MTVAFRLTIYQADGVTSDLTITSQRGGANPYITEVPSGDGQEVDLLTGAVRSGAYMISVADVVTGSTATGTVRLITNKLEDANYRQQLLARRAKLECSRDGGSSWSVWTFGYLTNIRQTDAITYAITVSDSRRIESTHTAFTWFSNTTKPTDERREFPNRGCILGGPLIESFGPARASGGWEFFWREVQSGYLALRFRAAYEPPSYARNTYPSFSRFMYDARNFLEKLPPIASLTGANYEQIRDREYVFAYPKLMAMVSDGTTTWYGSVRAAFTPVYYSGSGAGDRNLGPDINRQNFVYVELDPNQSTSYPATNTVVRVRILQRDVSVISPIYINEHPVDIATKLYSTVGIPFNTQSVINTKIDVGEDIRLALRVTEPVNLGEFLAESIFGPFGFSARTNASGEQEFFPTRIARSLAPNITIGADDIVGDAPPSVFDVDESTVVTSFKLTSKALVPFVPDPDNKQEPPADGMVEVQASQLRENPTNTTFATREVAYMFPGMVHDGSSGADAFVLSPEVVGRFFEAIVEEGFDRFGRGAIASEVQVLADSAAASLEVGDEVIINIPYYPNKNYRIGESNVGTRIAQIVRRTEAPEGPIFKLIDSGVNQQPASPDFTITSWSGDPRRVAQVTVTNAATLNSAQVTLAVQYQVSPTTPVKSGTIFTRFRPGTIPTSAFLMPIASPGSRVWVRMRTEKAESRASLWTDWEDVTLNSWIAPVSLTASAATGNSMTLTWSLNGNTLDPMDIFAYAGASAPADWTSYRIGTLSAGSITTIVRDLIPSTQYTFGVAFRDSTTGAYSGFATTTATTAAVNTTSCPAAPKMKVITSFENAGQTTGVVLSIGAVEGYNIVVQRAPNVSGSPGTWSDVAVLLPLTGYFADILPSDGVTRWYRVFYRLSGLLDGAAGPARSATPIAIPDDLILSEGPSIISGGSSLTFGAFLTGTPDTFYDGSTAQTVAVDATSNSIANKVVSRDATGNFSANVVTATLDGAAPAGSLTGTTLAANVVNSSITSVGTIATGVWQGSSVGKNYGGTGLNAASFSGITNERVFAYDGLSGSFFVAPSGSNGQALIYSGGALAWGNPAPGSHVLADAVGLGSQHTTSGLTVGMVLQATGATTARFQTPIIPASSVTLGTFGGTLYTFTNDVTISGTLTASLPFSSITGKPTTLSGYGITDGVSTSGSYANPSWITSLAWSKITGTPTTIAGYGITDAVSTSGSYADPSWITSLAGSKITGNISGSAANVTGIVAIGNGGTNQTAYATTGTGTRVLVYDQGLGKFDVQPAGTSGQFLRSSGTAGDVLWATPPNFSTTTTTAGYVPGSNGVGALYFLRADGTWAIPTTGSVSANSVTAGTFTGANYTFSNNVTFSSGVRVAFGETYKILNGGGSPVDVLSATTLGAGVVNSSLTSVGTLTSGAIGSGFTAIANSALANSSITINGTSVSLGGSITVPIVLPDIVTAGTFGGNNAIPRITVDTKGRITGYSTITPSGTWGIDISGNAATATTASAVNGNMSGTFAGNITWNTGVNINVSGESSFDLFSGGQWGVWESQTSNWWIRANWGDHLRLVENGKNVYVYGSRLYNDSGQIYLNAGNYSSYALPLSGGTLTGLTSLYAGSPGNSPALVFGGETDGAKKAIYLESYWVVIQGHQNEGIKLRTTDASGNVTDRMVVTTSGATINSNVALHAGNYSSYALPLSGGTVTGSVTLNATTWNGTITWNTGKDILVNGESSFDIYSGGTWGVWDIAAPNYFIKCAYGSQVEIGAAGSRGLKVIGQTDLQSGDVLINGSGWNGSRLQVTESSGSTAEFNFTGNQNGQAPVYVWNNAESGLTYFINFYSDGQGNPRTLRGYITYRRDTATMNLTTASDYRIKTTYGEYTKSGDIFDKIKVHEAKINGEGDERYPMVLAHELQEAYPSVVDGEKDAVNEDGTPKLQMVSYTAMIPLMLAEIKSLRARVAQLENQ